MSTHESERGQILLVTLLVLSVATTIALSLIGRTTTDTNITNQVTESSVAFSAAEAGLEEALQSGGAVAGLLSPGVNYAVTQTSIGGSTGIYTFPERTDRGETATLWLANHLPGGGLDEDRSNDYADGLIKVCWSTDAGVPAIIATLLYKVGATYRVGRAAYDSNTVAHGNNFTVPGPLGTNCGAQDAYAATITFSDLGYQPSNTLLALRLRPVYSATQLYVDATRPLPKQGNIFTSTGTTDSGLTRKISVRELYRAPESIFDYVIYSQNGPFGP
ncbi:MAG: hypothetical protein Q7S76_01065 [bacterium]|nr:hypothetical protein [bacterium]